MSRESQLSWFEPGACIKQDQELIDTITNNNFTQAVGVGDIDYFSQYVAFVDGPAKFGMVIVNEPFNFITLVDTINALIKNQMLSNGLLYLSINKYLAEPMQYDTTLPADYDDAILAFINKHVYAKVEQYFPCGNDGGNYFNWVHPLTRFYLRINNDCG